MHVILLVREVATSTLYLESVRENVINYLAHVTQTFVTFSYAVYIFAVTRLLQPVVIFTIKLHEVPNPLMP